MLGFILYSLIGAALILLGIHAFFSKKEVAFGFWANTDMFPVNNVKAYNKAVGKLWCVYGIILILLGTPLLDGQNSPLILISIIGVMAETIAAMVVYVTIIEKKYRKSDKERE